MVDFTTDPSKTVLPVLFVFVWPCGSSLFFYDLSYSLSYCCVKWSLDYQSLRSPCWLRVGGWVGVGGWLLCFSLICGLCPFSRGSLHHENMPV